MDPGVWVAIAMFAGASISDLQTRRVPNSYWLPFLLFAVFHGIASWPENRLGLAIAAAVCAGLYLLWRLRLFGGADAKGLMVAAILVPNTPDLFVGRSVFVLDALLSGAVVMLAYPVLFLVINLTNGNFRFPAMLLGTPRPLAAARASMVWPMQRLKGETVRWKYMQNPGEDLRPIFHDLERAGVDPVWTTPKVPFMVPLTVGMVIAAFWGNVPLGLVALLLQP